MVSVSTYFTFALLLSMVLIASRCQYKEDAANITFVRPLDVLDFEEQRCRYGVEWVQDYTPWWSFRTEVGARNATDVLTLPCPSFDARHIEGCYDNSLRHPRFRVSKEKVVAPFWYRLDACVILAPFVAYLTFAAERRLYIFWMRHREKVIELWDTVTRPLRDYVAVRPDETEIDAFQP